MAPGNPGTINPKRPVPIRKIDPQLDHRGGVEMQGGLDGTARRPERVQAASVVSEGRDRHDSKIHTAGYGRSFRHDAVSLPQWVAAHERSIAAQTSLGITQRAYYERRVGRRKRNG